MLEVSELTTKYGAISALREASLTVGAGEVVGLIGPNGAGKTTLLGSIAGLLESSGGTVTFDGADITTLAPEKILRQGLALVPEHRRIFNDMTVEENLKIGGATISAGERAEMLDEMAELFPVLKRKWDVAAGYMSGGEAQQVAIARALMSKPRMIMMDEPSLGLAPLLVDQVFELIDQLRDQGKTILVVEQNATRMLKAAEAKSSQRVRVRICWLVQICLTLSLAADTCRSCFRI
jgi:branched-chain amino acid transport system ATP-binding protein